VPLLERCLEPGTITAVVGRKYARSRHPAVVEALASPRTLVLFPSPDAVPLDIVAAEDNGPRTLLVLDGTWDYARNMYNGNRRLFEHLRKVCLPMSDCVPVSEYGIRKQPRAGCVSTLEAVAYALALLEHNQAIVDVRVGGRIHESRSSLCIGSPQYGVAGCTAVRAD